MRVGAAVSHTHVHRGDRHHLSGDDPVAAYGLSPRPEIPRLPAPVVTCLVGCDDPARRDRLTSPVPLVDTREPLSSGNTSPGEVPYPAPHYV